MPFPKELNQAVVDALAAAGDTSEMRLLEPMRGGMMSRAWRVGTKKRSYCFKYNEGRHSGQYSLEARDLEIMRSAGVRDCAAMRWNLTRRLARNPPSLVNVPCCQLNRWGSTHGATERRYLYDFPDGRV